jgi:predicted glycosyltransferase
MTTLEKTRKKIAFLPNHPSQIWVLRPVAEALEKDYEIIWFLRDKDVSIALAKLLGIEYRLLSQASKGYLGNGFELFFNIFKCIYYTWTLGIDVWVTKYGCGSIAAYICGKSAIGFNDDDTDIVPLIAATCYPFSEVVLVPNVIRMGRYQRRSLTYRSGHELFYLHPNRFQADQSVYKSLGIDQTTKFALVRLSALQAHHDAGIRGVSSEILRRILSIAAEHHIRIFITSEKPLDPEFEAYRLPIPAHLIHHALHYAEFLVGDSQTMTTEAAAVGTVAFRLSDFVGRISYIDHLEKCGVCFGYKPEHADQLLQHLERYLNDPKLKEALRSAHEKFLKNHIDPVPWFSTVIADITQGKRLRDFVQNH